MLLYYITDRTQFPGDETSRRRQLLDKIAEAARCGVDYVQLREKDLSARELESLAREAVQRTRETGTALLINSRTDVAIAVGAAGVHLRGDDISPDVVRDIWPRSMTRPIIGSPPDFGFSGAPSFGQKRSPVSYSLPHCGQTFATVTCSSASGVGCRASRPEPMLV